MSVSWRDYASVVGVGVGVRVGVGGLRPADANADADADADEAPRKPRGRDRMGEWRGGRGCGASWSSFRSGRRAGAEPTFLGGARFSCQGSGGCCRNYTLGPLTAGDVARIAALDVAGRWPELGAGPWLEERTLDDGSRAHYLRRNQAERCLFLL